MAKKKKIDEKKFEVIKLAPTVEDAEDGEVTEEKLAALAKLDPRAYSLKYRRWVMLFVDPKNKRTYGNATQAALAVYDTKDYATAGSIGYQNLKKLQSATSLVLDSLGYDFAKLMKIGAEKMEKEGYDTWEKFMVRIGVFEPMVPPAPQGGNMFNFDNLNVAIMNDRKARGLE